MGLEPFVDEGGLSIEGRGRHGRRSRWKTEAVEDLAGGLRRLCYVHTYVAQPWIPEETR